MTLYQFLDREGGGGEIRHAQVNLILIQQVHDRLLCELFLFLSITSLGHYTVLVAADKVLCMCDREVPRFTFQFF